MVLDVESPDPPDLTNRGLPSEFEAPEVLGTSNLRREELEEILRDGAWNEAFSEWATYTDLTEEEYQTIRGRGLFEQLDFYWDPVEERLRFEVPNPPAEWSTREDLVSNARAELTDLGHAVVEMLEDAYVDWGEEETSDAVWREEALGEESPYKD
ncbi:hypothetical protein E6P09_15440 (plasmid) [Haloferax mediterranei ATCC 33500]|uniref:DUF7992 domain-containing protein n=1 Tax=Haloferax mediterranei (strain ATCC 33500 / DSM 1411 / JCM 8866 / NBRC 14739 / NCIMB 2177 / R-4) TaxID=523841 RepID=I3RA89_HALMT|nr:hypothetical protein [Haloferax mediterranei]AFK21149.1 hypothetical protein HFX_6021 [Haloferax mediterranei ATCC 33500]AHZ24330.1 hypothetical protein BM92_15470 [Haloferax mediterranei ATCC 33500]ELZ97062.1 hypothetical protein C439_17108 [Haloferax mediterranei ATCC 33500]MDX5990192.1 hypothetical protein [Haloferax mediterranei ATCC 33500]QCQ76736.1 hypothetical protein E6P09_15440 [Haloferax mediterranei ATCC 33500]